MLYEKYEAKVKRSIARKHFILKYKYYLIALLSILLISMTAFFYFKGKITGSVLIADIKYGQTMKINDNLNSILSDYYLEFRASDDDSWSEKEPTKAGSYQVRGVSQGIFGRRYSRVTSFNIHKYDVGVKVTGPVEYQDKPIVNFTLSEGDIVDDTSYQIIIEKYEGRNIIGYLDSSNLRIKNANDDDVTNSYNFKTRYEFNVPFDNKKLNLTLENISDYDYNEKAFDDKLIKFSGLVDSLNIKYEYKLIDSYGVDQKGNILLPGNYQLVLSNVKLFDNDNDVTENYSFDEGSLKYSFNVNKRNIIVETNDITKVYDSQIVDSKDYTLTGILLDTHRIEVVNNTTLTNVGSALNKLQVKILNSNDEDITDLYNIDYVYGTITINKVDLNIKLLPIDNKVYDGLTVSYPDKDMNFNVVSGALVSTDSFRLNVSYYKDNTLVNEMKNQGIYEVKVDSILFSSGDESNYNITYDTCQFKIQKRDLEINFVNEVVNYDANSHVHSGKFTIVSGELAQGESLSVSLGGTIGNEVGVYNFTDLTFKINGLININYNIVSNVPVLEIIKTKADVKVSNVIVEYKGDSYYNDYNLEYSVVNMHHINFDNITWSFELNNEVFDSVINVGVYNIKFNEIVDKNYEVNIINNPTFEIRPAKLELSAVSVEKYYDGESVSFADYHDSYLIKSGSLLGDDIIDGITTAVNLHPVTGTTKDAGVYTVTIKDVSLRNTDINNYDITFVEGTYTIKKRYITLQLNNLDKVYDGLEFVYPKENNYTITNDVDFVSNEGIIINTIFRDFSGSLVRPINVGEYIVQNDSYEALPNTDLNNYTIYISDSKISIKPAEITIEMLKLDDKVYDGKTFNYPNTPNNFTITSGSLVNDDSFIVTPKYTDLTNFMVTDPINVGNYSVSGLDYTFTSGLEINYKINVIETNVSIKQRDVTIAAIPSTHVYDNQVFDYNLVHGNKFNCIVGNIIEGDIFDITVTYLLANGDTVDPVNTGSYVMNISSITGEKLYNYNITRNPSTLEITPRTIDVSIKDTVVKYTDTQFDPNNIIIDIRDLPANITYNVSLNYKVNNEVVNDVKNVGTYDAEITGITLLKDGLDDTYNYIVNLVGKTSILTIEKAEISISLGQLSKEYDGVAYTYDSKPIITGLLGDDQFTLKSVKYFDPKTNLEVNPINVGTYIVNIDKVEFVNTLDLSNYSFSVIDSNLTINKRNVSIDINPLTHIYDGKEYMLSSNLTYSLTQGSLDFVPGESITLIGSIFSTKVDRINPINAGTYNVLNESVSYNNLDPNNYNITINPSTLTISPRNVSVTLDSISDYVYRGEIVEYKDRLQNNVTGLLNGDTITATLVFRNLTDGLIYTQIKNIGKYVVENVTYTFTVGNKNNYNIETLNMFTFNVTSNAITITTDPFNGTFSGNKHTFTLDTFKLSSGTLFDGDNIECLKPFTCTNAGTYKNELTVKIINNQGIDVTNLYNITYVYGDVEILKANLNINYNNESIVKDYDNDTISLDYQVIGAFEKISVSFTYYDYETGEVVNDIKHVGHYKAFINITDDSILKNYNVIINNNDPTIFKEITINKVDLKITTATTTLNYKPGKTQNYTMFDSIGLVKGDTVIPNTENATTIMLPGSVTNKFTVNITDGRYNRTDCYNIVYEYGTLTIDNKLHTEKVEELKVYDGTPFGLSHVLTVPIYNGNQEIISDIRVTVYFKSSISLVNAGVYEFVVERVELDYLPSEANSYDPTTALNYINSYIFECDSVKVSIKQRDIMLKPNDYNKVYDGDYLITEEQDNQNFIVLPSAKPNDENYGLVGNHYITVTTELSTKYKTTDVFFARYMIVEASILDGNIDETSNYNIMFEYKRQPEDTDTDYYRKNQKFVGKARIKHRVLYLQTGSQSFKHDDTLKYCNVASVLDIDVPDSGLLLDHTYDVDYNSYGVSRIGKFKNRVRIKVYDYNGQDVTKNYRLNYSYSDGYITII